MKTLLITALLALTPGLAHADSVPAPVKEIMDVEIASWSSGDDQGDLFSTDRLGRLYSRDFAAKYTAATHFPAYGDDPIGSPFEHDVITSSQDGCPLEDISMKPNGAIDGAEDVVVTFRLMGCAEDAADKARVTEVHFRVIKEGGRPVVDDVLTEPETKGAAFDSLKATMASIVKP